MQIRHITAYHAYMQIKGANMAIMAFIRPTKEYKWYGRGWVVSGYAGADSHKYFPNKETALAFVSTKTIKAQ